MGFTENGKKSRNKEIKNYINVSVVVDIDIVQRHEAEIMWYYVRLQFLDEVELFTKHPGAQQYLLFSLLLGWVDCDITLR